MRHTKLTGKVVVDAMGSDRAPHPEIDGALAATRDFRAGVILVGQPEVVLPELRRCGWRRDGDKGVEFVEAPEFIRMDEAVAYAVRGKRRSSMRVGARLDGAGHVGGFGFARNTGAAVGTSEMVLGVSP